MNFRIRLQVVAITGFLWAASPPSAGESARPLTGEENKVRTWLLEGKLAELEAEDKRTRDLSLVASDGQQLRAGFYAGLDCACRTASRDEIAKQLGTVKKRVDEWVRAYPQSTSAKIAKAGYHRQVAWNARGESYARDVPKDAWPIYKENLAAAARILDSMEASAMENPDWYVARLENAREQSEPRARYEALLEEAMQRHPRYLPIYFEGSTHYSPSWGGSNAQLNAFIDKAVARTRDWLGDSLYSRLHWSNTTSEMFRNGQADWTRFQASMKKVIADYPDDWNLNNYARFACMSRDMTAAMEALKRIEGRVKIEAWNNNMAFYAQCKQVAEQIANLPGMQPAK